MATSAATTVEEYLAELPMDRRADLNAVRNVILENLPEGYEECMQYGMIGYVIPLEKYPVTYNKQPLGIAALAAQKNYFSLYLMNVYGDPETERWFVEEYRASGKKLDNLPLDLIGRAVARTPVDDFIEMYEVSRRRR
ncbi:MAG: DUF1801 domain-containing protein [Chloroflexi bacterium]|nr:DUF1801 domain-containing protein [Chloroflexota bacterium]